METERKDYHMFSPEERQRAVDLYLTTPMTTAQVVEHLGHPTRQCLERWPAADSRYACVLMLLYIVKGFGVLGWLVRGGDGLDPEGGATFEFGQVAGAAFDLADAAGVDAEGVADLLLGDAVRDA